MLIWKGPIFGGAYRREICISKLAGLIIIEGKFVSKFLNVQLARNSKEFKGRVKSELCKRQ